MIQAQSAFSSQLAGNDAPRAVGELVRVIGHAQSNLDQLNNLIERTRTIADAIAMDRESNLAKGVAEPVPQPTGDFVSHLDMLNNAIDNRLDTLRYLVNRLERLI